MTQPGFIQAPPPSSTLLTTERRSWVRRHPLAAFLIALTLGIFSAPFDEQFKDGDIMEGSRVTVLLLAALLAVGGRSRALVWGIVLVTPAVVGKWLSHLQPGLLPAWVYLTPGLIFVMFVVANLLRFILRAVRVDSEVLCASVAAYLLLALLWSFAYTLVCSLNPNAFVFTTGPDSSHVMKGVTALYFSFITLSTVGYGDICPASGAARMLAASEATVGLFYATVLIARLVALYSSPGASSIHGPPAKL